MAVGRLPEDGVDPRSQPTMSRLENLPRPVALERMMAATVELFCDSFEDVPRWLSARPTALRSSTSTTTGDRVEGGQQLALFHAHHDGCRFSPMHIREATTGEPLAVILRPGRTPDRAEVAPVLRHVVKAIRARWPRVDILIRGDSHYARHEAMTWCEHGYVLGLDGNQILPAEVAALGRVSGEAEKVRRFGEFRYAARSWKVARGVISRFGASAQASDGRFIITHLAGTPRWLYESIYCQSGHAEI